ncbi:MAG: hypothetical protein GX161_05615 [Firmicutes bacterium]|nr:hypothetical protein [Bacillota bacterium]
MKKWHLVGLAVVALLAVGLYTLFIPTPKARFSRQVAEAFQAGDLEAARRHLEAWAEETSDGIDRTAIMSLHMAVSVAQVVRDAQLLVEYEGMNMMFADPEDALDETISYDEVIAILTEQLRRDQEELLQTAKVYHGQHYKGGLRIDSPVQGTLDLLHDEDRILDAYRALIAGYATEDEQAIFHAGVAREALGAVLRLVIVQPDGQSADAVALQGTLDMAELWWLIAAHSTDVHFSETALGIVLAETETRPDHPARARAEAALREVRRFG